jgi:hypothetical protein
MAQSPASNWNPTISRAWRVLFGEPARAGFPVGGITNVEGEHLEVLVFAQPLRFRV